MRVSYILVVLLLLGLIGLGFMHEQVHVEIFRSYGIESHIDYVNYFPDLATVGESTCPTDSCELAHNINEAITYPLTMFYLVFGIFGLTIVIILEDIHAKLNHRRNINGKNR